jgi:hypothetical protein
VREARRSLRELRATASTLRKALYADPAFKGTLDAIDREAHAKRLAARKASGLFHGNYLEAESAAKGAKLAKGMPRFKRWDGDGKAGTQVQGGCTLAEAMAGTDTRLRITIDPTDARPKPRAVIAVRVGSIDRKPVWAESRVRWHRALPADATVKWAYVLRRRVGLTDHWSILLTVSRAGGFPDRANRATTGRVTVRRRWTATRDGLVVAEWSGDDGRSGQLVIPAFRASECSRAEQFQATADIRFNDAVATIAAWRKGGPMPGSLISDRAYVAGRLATERKPSAVRATERRLAAIDGLIAAWPASPPAVPEAFDEQFAHAHLWKSSGRLAKVAYWFRDNPDPATAPLAAWVEQWRRHDKHLRNFAAHARRKFQQWRREHYRLFAVRLRAEYAKCEVTKLDVPRLAKRPPTEDPDPIIEAIRYNQRTASPGFLAATLAQFGPTPDEPASDDVVSDEPLPLEGAAA